MYGKDFFYRKQKVIIRQCRSGFSHNCFQRACAAENNYEDYPYFANRNFLYLTGIKQANIYLVTWVTEGGCREILYLLLPDILAERWTSRHIKEQEVQDISGITNFANVENFQKDLEAFLCYDDIFKVYLDFDEAFHESGANDAYRFGDMIKEIAPYVRLRNLHPNIRRQRTIKKPCEIEAMRKAVSITKAGIEAIMRASHPGIYEYEYKAEFDYALAKHGVLVPRFSFHHIRRSQQLLHSL